MKMLFTAPSIVSPPIGGPELRITNSIKALSRLVELHVFPRRIPSASTRSFLQQTCQNIIEGPVNPISNRRSILHRAVRKIATKVTPGAVSAFDARMDARHVVKRYTELLVHYARSHQITAAWFGYGCISYPLMKSVHRAAPDLRIVCDTDSVWSQFISRELDHEVSDLRRKVIIKETRTKIAEEKRWVNFCDVTAAVCDADARYYRGLANDPSRIKIFRNAIDETAYELDVAPPPGHRRPNIVMTGSYYSPNSPMVRAARWVHSQVFPQVSENLPGLHLYLVGRGSDRYLKDIELDHVTVTGQVELTLPYLKHANVALVALPFEAAGAKFKVLEAAVCGIPIVASPNGAEGLPQSYGEYLTICHSSGEFVSAILKNIIGEDEQKKRLQQFRALVSTEFGLEQLTDDAREILKAIS